MRTARIAVLLVTLAGPAPRAGQPAAQADDHDDTAPLQVGYAVVTPVLPTTGGLAVFESFGLKKGTETEQAAIVPGALVTRATLFVAVSKRLGRDLGLAISNPGASEAKITLALLRDDGIAPLGDTRTKFVLARRQTSSFITEIFSDPPAIPAEFTGTVTLTSTVPVAVVGMRFRGTSFSPEPLINSLGGGTVPEISTGVGGAGASLIPHFAANAGWATEIVIVNTSTAQAGLRVDFFQQDGKPMTVRLNGSSRSTFFNLTFPGAGVFTMAPRDTNGDSRF